MAPFGKKKFNKKSTTNQQHLPREENASDRPGDVDCVPVERIGHRRVGEVNACSGSMHYLLDVSTAMTNDEDVVLWRNVHQ